MANEDSNKYTGFSKGLFGETDRSNGEYHFRSGETQKIYSNAHYVPVSDDTVPPQYFRPEESKKSGRERSRNNKGLLAVLTMCLSCAIIGGLIGASIMSAFFSSRVEKLEDSMSVPGRSINFADSEIASEAAYSAQEKELSPTEIYSRAQSQVVMIVTEYNYKTGYGQMMPGTVTGSGFVISEDGYILTNYHVVEKAYEGDYPVTVTFQNGNEYNGTVKGFDQAKDIAVIKIDAGGLTPVSIDNYCESVVGGANITIAGNPYGMFNVSSGHISNPSVTVAVDETYDAIDMIQLDVSVYEGNSGGPVYNNLGNVIGMVTAKVSANNSEGIGFAIPMDEIAPAVSDLIENGITVGNATLSCDFYEEYNQMFKAYYSLPEGAFVDYVYQGGCAEKAGIRVGDVIAQIGDYYIRNNADVTYAMKYFSAGDTADVLLYREGRLMQATVTFDQKP